MDTRTAYARNIEVLLAGHRAAHAMRQELLLLVRTFDATVETVLKVRSPLSALPSPFSVLRFPLSARRSHGTTACRSTCRTCAPCRWWSLCRATCCSRSGPSRRAWRATCARPPPKRRSSSRECSSTFRTLLLEKYDIEPNSTSRPARSRKVGG